MITLLDLGVIIASVCIVGWIMYSQGKHDGIEKGINMGIKSNKEVLNLVTTALYNKLRKSQLELDSLKYPPVEIPQTFFTDFQESLNNKSE
jgi:hypothetical protein